MERTQTGEEVEMPARVSDEMEKKPDDIELARTKSLESQVSFPRECLVVLLISLAQFTTQNMLGQTMSLIHIIGNHYNITNPGVESWFVAGYALTVGTFILFSGRLGDLFGWKKMLVIGYAWSGVWAIVSGLAWYSDHVLFIFSRVIGGIGPAICLPNGLAMLGALYRPGKRKNMAFAVFGGSAPVGAISGFVVAGLFNLVWWPCKLEQNTEPRLGVLTWGRGILVYWNCAFRDRNCRIACGKPHTPLTCSTTTAEHNIT